MNVNVDVFIIVIKSIQILHHQSNYLIIHPLISSSIFEYICDAFISVPIVQQFPVKVDIEVGFSLQQCLLFLKA